MNNYTPPTKNDGNCFSVYRRHFLNITGFISIGAATGFLSGCVSKVNKHYDEKSKHTYQERINQILISQDEKYVVVLCDQYHYVINIDPNLLKAIKSGLHTKMIARFYEFTVSENNNLQGTLNLTIPDSITTILTEEELEIAKTELGFSIHNIKSDSSTKTYANKVFKIEGQRYDAGGFQLPETIKKLNREYMIQIVERIPLSEEDKKEKANLTPIAEVAEGAIVLILGPFIILLFPALAMIGMLGDSIGKAASSTQRDKPTADQ